MSSEGDYTPRTGRPIPLTKAQLREMKKKFEKASERIDEIKTHEKNHKEDVESPEWL